MRSQYTCDTCGTQFLSWPSHHPRFCSRQCYVARPPESLITYFESRLDVSGECWLWTGLRNQYGYGIATYQKHRMVASRVAYELTHGPIPPGLHVLHRCDNPPCCRPSHLFLGTATDNTNDRVAKGRSAKGSQLPHARLNEAAVKEIRRLHETTSITAVGLAAQFRVHPATIHYAIHRRTWKHV